MPDNQYKIGLATWLLFDGVFDDFVTGQVFKGFLNFSSIEKYALKSQGHKYFQYTKSSIYKVEGEIVYHKDSLVVVDCGVRLFLPKRIDEKTSEDKYYEAIGYLELDDIYVKKESFNDPDMPELVYHWRVDRILLENIPYIRKVEPNGRKITELDEANTMVRVVNETDAWRDEAPSYKGASGLLTRDYSAHYILECTLLEDAPRKVER